MESTITYSENLQRLQRFFLRPDEAGYAFVVAADERLIPEINRQLTEQARAHGRRLAMINLESEGEASLMMQLSRAAQEADGLLITSVSTFLNQRGKEALLSFNFSREALRQLNLPLLFWIDAKHLQALSRQAADLYSQRRMSTLFFEKPLDTSHAQNRLETRFTGDFRSTDEYERLQYRLALLEAQYDEVKTHPPKRFLPDYVLPLARVYSELDLHADAIKLISPYLESLLGQTSPDLLSQTGDILFAARHYEPALQAYTQALEHLPPERTQTHSYLFIQLGDLNQEIGRMQEAERYFTADLELNQTEGEKLGLTISYDRLGSLFQAQGKFEQALEFFQKDNELGEELFQANPHSESLKHGVAISYEKLGSILQTLGKFEEAQAYFLKEVQLQEKLFQANPHSDSLKYGLATSYGMIGDLYGQMEQSEKSYEFIHKATTFFEELFQANPRSYKLINGLAMSYIKLGGLFQEKGELSEARSWFERARDIWKELSQHVAIPEPEKNLRWVEQQLENL